MAVFLRGQVYWARYRDCAGELVRVSLRTRSKATAERLLAELEDRETARAQGAVTVEQLLAQWLSVKLTNTTKVRSREVYQLQAARFTKLWGTALADDFPIALVEKFKRERLESGTSPSTVNQDVGHFTAALRWGQSRGLIRTLPRVERIKQNRRRVPKELSDDQLRALLSHVRDAPRCTRLAPVIKLALEAGLRAGEIEWLKWSQVDLDSGWINVSAVPGLWAPKNGSDRSVPIRQSFVDWLKRYRDALPMHDLGDWVCPQSPGRKWDRRYLSLLISKLFKTAGVHIPGAHHRLHLLRGTFATRYLRGGGDVESLRSILGHATLSVTALYLSATDDSKRRGLRGLDETLPDD